MRRAAFVVRLRKGSRARAAELVAQGPPFDLGDTGFERHAVFLSEEEAVFVFEGVDAEWQLDDLVSDAFHPHLHRVLEEWRPLVEGEPRLAGEVYFWERGRAQEGT